MTMRRSAIILLLCAVALEIHAQAPASFSKGVLAFENKEWKDAEKLMRETIAANPKESPGTVSISGSWFETYVPHYFLARALAKQGKCAEALKEFEETERQGIAPTIGDFARHIETRGGCKPQPKSAKPKEVVFETSVPFGEEGPAPATTTTAPSPKPTVIKPPQPTVAVVPPPRNTAGETARLSMAIDAYLHGHYEETAQLLSATRFDDRTAAAEAALFRAAARHALYRISGEKDAGLRAQIDADLRQYRTLRPNPRPDPRLFPPGFIALATR
jgi:tetratricopeptide (TPR) repeat protein